jgi:hypothetical protein
MRLMHAVRPHLSSLSAQTNGGFTFLSDSTSLEVYCHLVSVVEYRDETVMLVDARAPLRSLMPVCRRILYMNKDEHQRLQRKCIFYNITLHVQDRSSATLLSMISLKLGDLDARSDDHDVSSLFMISHVLSTYPSIALPPPVVSM